MTAPSPPPSLLSAGELASIVQQTENRLTNNLPIMPGHARPLLAAYRAQEAQLAKYACPLGMENGNDTCSSGSCPECLADRVGGLQKTIELIGYGHSRAEAAEGQLADLRAKVERQREALENVRWELLDDYRDGPPDPASRAGAILAYLDSALSKADGASLPLPPDLGERKWDQAMNEEI